MSYNFVGGGQPVQQPRVTMQDALGQLRQNPSGILRQAGFNVPGNLSNPQQIVQHLMQTGQVPQNRMAQVMQMLSGMRK